MSSEDAELAVGSSRSSRHLSRPKLEMISARDGSPYALLPRACLNSVSSRSSAVTWTAWHM